MKKISGNVFNVGVNDDQTDLFESQYKIPDGISYNSYVVVDEQIAIFDTVDINFFDQWLSNIKKIIEKKQPDYLIIQHMEPDHSANIKNFMDIYPNTKIVANLKTFKMIKQFFGIDFQNNKIIVSDGDILSIGKHSFNFIFAPMVHWPEVMVTYESFEKILFSADAFGKFGILGSSEDWIDEARRYYISIVGKYGKNVQTLLKKVSNLDIKIICSLHGPMLKDNLDKIFNLYNIWSSYYPEQKGLVIAYTSIYGNTKYAVNLLKTYLKKLRFSNVISYDLARCDISKAVSDAFKYDKLVLATTTYNAGIFPFMKQFLDYLTDRNYKNRYVGIIENGSWAPVAAKIIKSRLLECENIKIIDPVVTINSSLNEVSENSLNDLAISLNQIK